MASRAFPKKEAGALVALIAVGVAWMYIGELSVLLGAALAFRSEKRARGVVFFLTLFTCLNAYGFLGAVGARHGFAVLAYLGMVASIVLAILPGELALRLAYRVGRTLPERALLLPFAWALLAALTPMVFPFRPAYLAVTSRPLSQWLAVGGPSLLDAIVIGVGTALVVAARERGRTRGLALAFVTLTFAGGFGLFHAARASRRPSVTVGVVSPAITLEDGRDPQTRAARLERLHALTRSLEGAALVVWPESVYPYPVRTDARGDAPAPHGARPEGFRAPMLVGAPVGELRCRRRSSLVLMEARVIRARVDKERLMPFGDVVPFRVIPSLAAAFPCGTREGERFAPLDVGALRVGGMLCYDEVHPDVARARVLAGASVLVSGSNDAWYAGTEEPELHARVARARAIETRRDLVRAVNMGEGGLVASTGEVLVRMSGTAPEARRIYVAPSRARTPYVRLGAAVEVVFALILAVLVLRARRAARTPAA